MATAHAERRQPAEGEQGTKLGRAPKYVQPSGSEVKIRAQGGSRPIAPPYVTGSDYRAMSVSPHSAALGGAKPRVAADVALALLEVIQQQDTPTEVFEDEDVTRTMPRRLGLSEVVDRQVRIHRENARRRRRVSDGELGELMRLVMRRPDSPEVFFEVGARLAADLTGPLVRVLPCRVAILVLKGRIAKRLKRLFGRRIGGFAPGSFVLEGSASLFVQADPGGDACQLVTGFCQRALRDALGRDVLVVEQACEARGDPCCRWSLVDQGS